MIHVKTLTNLYEIIEPMFEVLRRNDCHCFIENDGALLEFSVIDDGGNNGIYAVSWLLADNGYIDYEVNLT